MSKQTQQPCRWTEDKGNWDTDCDEKHILLEGTPPENKMRFCCYCGRPLKARRFKAEVA